MSDTTGLLQGTLDLLVLKAVSVALSVLGIVTMVAGYVPARQASRIDPVRALRAE